MVSNTFLSARFLLVLTFITSTTKSASLTVCYQNVSVILRNILPEFRYYYVDGLHFSHFGLKKVCSIILSNLYKVLAPSKHKKRKSSGSDHAKSRRRCHVASSSELKLGCLNVQSFRTAQVYFSELIDSFDICNFRALSFCRAA